MNVRTLFVAALVALFSSHAFAGGTATYANARFGYLIAYPAGLFVAQPESENGDGREFRGVRGGPGFLVWGGYNALQQSPAAMADEAEQDCLSHPAAYRIAKANLVAVSCETKDGILYRKTLIRGDTLTSFQMTYPKAGRARWDSIVAKISGSLVAGHGN